MDHHTNHDVITGQDTWSRMRGQLARPVHEGGQRKRTTSNRDTAPLADPTAALAGRCAPLGARRALPLRSRRGPRRRASPSGHAEAPDILVGRCWG